MHIPYAVLCSRRRCILIKYFYLIPTENASVESHDMNLEKSKKRIAKRAKMGFQGYPTISFTYYGKTTNLANEVVVEFVLEENAEIQIERFSSKLDAREDETIQSALVKIIERSGAKTVSQTESVFVIA
jgi:hypothetical protein